MTSGPSGLSHGFPRRVHLVGIGGMHMSAIAQMLLLDGVTVSGSDMQETALTRRLAELGATVYQGHDAANVGDADLVVMTAAAKQENPEVAAARERGVPVILRAEAVARLMEGRTGIAVAGTHGKTTTSSLVAWILQQAGRAPMYLLGGESLDLGGNAGPGDGPFVVVEADEYARAFLEYRPRVAVVLNVEADHLEQYGSVEAVVDAFRGFLKRVPDDGVIIAYDGSPLLDELVREGTGAHLERYRVVPAGASPDLLGTEWAALDAGPDGRGGRGFTVARHGELFGAFTLNRPGLHNLANATAAIAAAAAVGVTAEEMTPALASFRGAARRFQTTGEAGGVIVVDDFAHHPTEVRATIAAAREAFPGRRIAAVFQPHTYSRTAYLLDEFRICFAGVDTLVILETFAARETPDAGMSAADLAQVIEHLSVRYAASVDEAAQQVVSTVEPGDVVLTLGAGNVHEVGPAVLHLLATPREVGR